MTRWRVLAVSAAGVMFVGAGVAVAGSFTSSAQSDFYAAGHHEFYMWCPASQDYMTTETGKDAEDAQLRLYDATKASGREGCWPVWQGRIKA